MGVELYVTAVGILIVLAFSFLTWRAVIHQKSGGAAPDVALADIARLQERTTNLQLTLDKVSAELKSVSDARDSLQIEFTQAREKFAATQQAEKELRERITRADAYIKDRDEKIIGLEKIVEEFRANAGQSERELAKLSERHASLEKGLEDKKQELSELQQKLQTEFKNIATDILNTATEQLTTKSGESLRVFSIR